MINSSTPQLTAGRRRKLPPRACKLTLFAILASHAAAEPETPAAGPPPGRPPFRTGAEVFTEYAASRRARAGAALRLQTPLSRNVMGEAAAARELHRFEDGFARRLYVNRWDIGGRARLHGDWSAFGGLTLTGAAEQGASLSDAVSAAGRIFAARRHSDQTTLAFGGIFAQNLRGGYRWLVVPGIEWRPRPGVTLRTAEGIVMQFDPGGRETLSARIDYRRQSYGLRDRPESGHATMTVSSIPVSLAVRRRAPRGAWMELGAGAEIRPRETLYDARGRRAERRAPSSRMMARLAAGMQF